MRTKQEIIENIQEQYNLGNNAEQEIYAWLSDEVLNHRSTLTFVKTLERELKEELYSITHYDCIDSLIKYIKGGN